MTNALTPSHDQSRARLDDRFGRRHESERRNDDFVAGTDVDGGQGYAQGRGARRNRLGMGHSEFLGRRGLELAHFVNALAEGVETVGEQNAAVGVEQIVDGFSFLFTKKLETGHGGNPLSLGLAELA